MENKSRAAVIFLIVSAIMYGALGFLFLINPAGMSTGLGYENLNSAGLTDVMATYGGLEIGIGLSIFYCAKTGRVETGLLIVLLTFGGFAFGRVMGAFKFGGFNGLHFYWFLTEIFYIFLTCIFIKKSNSKLMEANA